MIFLTVGTCQHPFDRLVVAADELARAGEEVVIQSGSSHVRPAAATAIDFLPSGALERYVHEARVVVCHAGVGSVATCLRQGKKPIMVPRRRVLGEQVDDHQLTFARRITELGLGTTVEDLRDLPVAVCRVDQTTPPQSIGLSEGLAAELVDYIRRAVAERR